MIPGWFIKLGRWTLRSTRAVFWSMDFATVAAMFHELSGSVWSKRQKTAWWSQAVPPGAGRQFWRRFWWKNSTEASVTKIYIYIQDSTHPKYPKFTLFQPVICWLVAIGYIIILLETPSPFHQRLLFDPLGILVSACLLVAIEMSVVATCLRRKEQMTLSVVHLRRFSLDFRAIGSRSFPNSTNRWYVLPWRALKEGASASANHRGGCCLAWAQQLWV